MQDEIAGLIAKNLALRITSPSQATAVDPEAYQLLLKARQTLNQSYQDYERVITLCKASLAIDPNAAPTWATLSLAGTIRMGMSSSAGTVDTASDARNWALRGIELDPTCAAAYAALASVQFAHDFDWAGAVTSLKKALALAPGDAYSISLMATLAMIIGRAERGVELGKQAFELDPLNSVIAYVYGKALFQARRFTELEALGKHMTANNPTAPYGHVFLVYSRTILGRPEDAAQAAPGVPPGFFHEVCKVHALLGTGRLEEGERALDQLKAVFRQTGAYQVAQILAHYKRIEEAFEWLEISFANRDPGLTWLINDTFMDSLRGDPRWQDVMHHMHLSREQIAAEPSLAEL